MDGIELTVKFVAGLGKSSEGARIACALLDTVARTLSGVTEPQAESLHEDFARAYGRANAAVKKAKASGGKVSFSGEADFAKAGVRPPFLCTLAEAGDKVFKLRKLYAFPGDTNLAVDVSLMERKHAERWELLPEA